MRRAESNRSTPRPSVSSDIAPTKWLAKMYRCSPLHPIANNTTSTCCNYLETGESRIMGHDRELEAVRKDGSIFPISLRVSELKRDNEHVFIGLIQDITQRKLAERQQRQAV